MCVWPDGLMMRSERIKEASPLPPRRQAETHPQGWILSFLGLQEVFAPKRSLKALGEGRGFSRVVPHFTDRCRVRLGSHGRNRARVCI